MDSYTYHISLYGLLFFAMIIVGLTFALLLWFVNGINRSANRFLSLALFTIVPWMVRVLVMDIHPESRLPFQFLLALGPLLYFYVLKITRPKYRFGWKDLLHFSPLVLEQAILPFQPLAPLLQLLVFISLMVYLYQCNRLIENFYGGLPLVLMDRPRLEFRWLKRLVAATALLWCLWIACSAFHYFGFHHPPGQQIYYSFYILFVVMIIWTAIAAFLRPQAAAIAQSPLPARQPVPPELRAKGSWLKKMFEANRYFEDPELDLAILAKKINLPPRELSKIINTVFKKSFNDFVNEYRVRDMVSKMQDPAYDNMTLLGIAFEAGFNSKATFNRVFKQVTGKAPAEFKNKAEKEVSSRVLRRWPGSTAVISGQKLNRHFMFQSYLKIAWRNITRNKAFSFINIFGLGLGMACSLLIFLWVQDERSINRNIPGAANTYVIYEDVISDGKPDPGYWTPGLLSTELKRNFPEIKYASGFFNRESETAIFEAGDKIIPYQGNCYADSDFFKILQYPLLQGTPASALAGPDDIAISRKMAESFFGNAAAAFGKTLRFNNARNFRVSAVFDNLPGNASEQYNYIFNWKFLLSSVDWLADWIYRSPYTFIQLQPNADAEKVNDRIKNFLTPYLANSKVGNGYQVTLGLQPFTDMYLHSEFKNGKPAGGRIEYVQLFSMVAIFILLIACINFMNLATARSVKRAKEVGIRKAVGALRLWLIFQFIGEAIMLSALAVVLAIATAVVLLPFFNQLTNKQITMPFSSAVFWLNICAFTLLTGLIAGSYPALFLSSLNPVKVLKGSLKFSQGSLLFRKGLVVFQFVLSIVLITATIIVSKQVNYMQTKDLGFDKENLIYMPFQGDLLSKYEVYKQQLSNMPGIQSVTRSTQPPSKIGAHVYDIDWEGKNPQLHIFAMHDGVGYGYIKMMGLKITEGRDFSQAFPSDSTGYILNETAVKMTGYKNPVGKRFSFFGQRGTIIGVVKDFHLSSLHDPIQPLILYLAENADWGNILVKTQAGKTRQALANMEKAFKQLEPKFAFRYYFADEEYQKLYASDLTVNNLSNSFSVLAIFISCLGLLGLTMFTAEQRRKEIGVRKVIGASVANIVAMLSKDTIKLVALSAIIATPVAWLALSNWLQNFAYRVSISWWIFVSAGGAALLIALATISYQAIKAALANPSANLRSE